MIEIHKRTGIILAFATIIIIISIAVENVLYVADSVQYSSAIKFIKTDPTINQRFGAITSFGIPSGEINLPKGYSYFKIKVKGELLTRTLKIELKEGSHGTWNMEGRFLESSMMFLDSFL